MAKHAMNVTTTDTQLAVDDRSWWICHHAPGYRTRYDTTDQLHGNDFNISQRKSKQLTFRKATWAQQVGGPITRRSLPRDDAQGYVSVRCDSRAETYPCASSRGNASRGNDRRVIGPRLPNSLTAVCLADAVHPCNRATASVKDSINVWKSHMLDRVHNSRRPCGAVSLSGVTTQWDGSLVATFCTFWPCDLIFIGERCRDRLSLCQVWRFLIKPFWFYRVGRHSHRQTDWQNHRITEVDNRYTHATTVSVSN